MNALKAQWVVTAGIILGQPIGGHTKQYAYTPGLCNWVNIEFIWL
jgi:hypothetical protein